MGKKLKSQKLNGAEAIEFLRKFQDYGEPAFIDEWGDHRCLYCKNLSGHHDPKYHRPDCLWVQLKQLDLT
jgi:hypothetical protein